MKHAKKYVSWILKLLSSSPESTLARVRSGGLAVARFLFSFWKLVYSQMGPSEQIRRRATVGGCNFHTRRQKGTKSPHHWTDENRFRCKSERDCLLSFFSIMRRFSRDMRGSSRLLVRPSPAPQTGNEQIMHGYFQAAHEEVDRAALHPNYWTEPL